MISVRRMAALIQQEWFISKRSLEVIMDVPFFSAIDVVLFGFVSIYLLGSSNALYGQYLLLGAMLWEVIRVTQYSMSVSSMWNVWSRNLSNMFIAPISLTEFVLSSVLSAISKSLLIIFGLAGLAYLLFEFNIFVMGFWPFLWYSFNLAVFGCTVGLALLGLIFRYGTRIQALAWALIFLFQPLCATYFPVDVLPPALRLVAYALPPSYFFEGARASLTTGSIDWSTQWWGVILNLVYCFIGFGLFRFFYNRARVTGQMARLEN